METIPFLLSNLKLLSSEAWLQKVRAGVKHMSVSGRRVINMFVAAVDICLLCFQPMRTNQATMENSAMFMTDLQVQKCFLVIIGFEGLA